LECQKDENFVDSADQLSYSPIRSFAHQNTALSLAALAQENANDAGEDSPFFEASCDAAPSCTIPLPHDIPTSYASQIPSDTRDYARGIDVRSAVLWSVRQSSPRIWTIYQSL
jgi:hypothetical protein